VCGTAQESPEDAEVWRQNELSLGVFQFIRRLWLSARCFGHYTDSVKQNMGGVDARNGDSGKSDCLIGDILGL